MRIDKIFENTRIFNPADIQASKFANIIKAKMIKKSKHPVLITVGRLIEDERPTDFVVRIHEKIGIDIIATGGSSKHLIKKEIKSIATVFTPSSASI